MEEMFKLIGNYGFPMVVAGYLLVRLEPLIRSLERSVTVLTVVVERSCGGLDGDGTAGGTGGVAGGGLAGGPMLLAPPDTVEPRADAKVRPYACNGTLEQRSGVEAPFGM